MTNKSYIELPFFLMITYLKTYNLWKSETSDKQAVPTVIPGVRHIILLFY